ncbi:MAG: hypothetical protein QNL05_00615 [Gammaproteobacteria bacterium]|nr:hypothetical protein [Gammaproteobacteria bacterium]
MPVIVAADKPEWSIVMPICKGAQHTETGATPTPPATKTKPGAFGCRSTLNTP